MKQFVLSKKYWFLATAIVIGIFVWFMFKPTGTLPDGIEMGTVAYSDVLEIVSETGVVSPSQEVTLAFERSGKMQDVLVAVGSEVHKDQVLLKLDASAQSAELNAARARKDAEEIRLAELIRGADETSLAVSQTSVVSSETTLENAKRTLEEVTSQHNQLVDNALKALRSTGLEAYLLSDERPSSDDSFTPPTITGTYDHSEEGSYIIELYNSGASSGSSFRISGLESGSASVSTMSPIAIGSRGLFIQFPENFASNTRWEIQIPNTRSSSYLTYVNAYTAAIQARTVAITSAQNAVKTAEAAVAQSQQQHVQSSTSARDERIEAQRALVRQMQAAVQAAQIGYDNTILRAPFDGIVTAVQASAGEIVPATAPMLSLISQADFEIEVLVSESDIQELNRGDKASITFDAYDDLTFDAHITSVSPHALVADGVRVFEVTLQFDQQHELIRSGLSANVDILTAKREQVIAVPSRAIAETADGKFVRTLVGKEVQYLPVTVGLRGSDGQSEILSGLSEGQSIITFADSSTLKLLESY